MQMLILGLDLLIYTSDEWTGISIKSLNNN